MTFQLHHANSAQKQGSIWKILTALSQLYRSTSPNNLLFSQTKRLKYLHGITILIAAILTSLLATAQAHETGYGSDDGCYPNCETIEIPIEVSDPSIVNLRFYSSDRDWYWPGPDRSWIIDDYEERTYHLQCEYGEKICYGAWKQYSESETWGVGKSVTNGCTNCCWTCNSGRVTGKNLI